MDKKKFFLGNFRLNTKLPNLMKKKEAGKKPRKLVYRRSVSVPDLHQLATRQPSPTGSGLLSVASDTFSFASSESQSDSDSIASGHNSGEPSSGARKADLVPVKRSKAFHRDREALLANRVCAPVGKSTFYTDVGPRATPTLGHEKTVSFPGETPSSQVDGSAKSSRETPPTSSQIYFPLPAARSIINVGAAPTAPTSAVERANPSTEKPAGMQTKHSPGGVAAALARAGSLGESPKTQSEQRAPPSEGGTPPATRHSPGGRRLPLPNRSTPVESGDGASPDSARRTPPGEEKVPPPWTTHSEDLLAPSISEIFSLEEEAQLEEYRLEEEDRLEEARLQEARLAEALLEEEALQEAERLQEAQGDATEVAAPGPEVPSPLPIQRYLLNINLKEGRNLVIKKKRSGTSDPYVKFRLEGKQFYKSKVVYKNLNPLWNETFSHPLRDRHHVIEAKVYDKNRTSDEFMGSTTISLKNLDLYKHYELELPLVDAKSKDVDMGVIVVEICLMFRDATIKRTSRWPPKKNKQPNQAQGGTQNSTQTQRTGLKNQLWTGVLGVTLVEGQELPQHGQGDIYVCFRMAEQKYKSKNLCIQANPQWREHFDFNQFEDNQEPLQVEVFSKRGRKSQESWGMFEVDLSRVRVNERQLYTHVLDPEKGRLVFLVTLTPCWGVSISDIKSAPLEQPDEREAVLEKFSLKNSHRSLKEVGFLQVKVIKAADLSASDINGKSDPYCVIELGNSRLQTQTVYKTLNPEWNKVFTFPIKDIHDVVELTVLDENVDKAPSFLGKVAIPLLSVNNGQQIVRFLKKDDLGRLSRGSVTLELDVIYNRLRAGVRTFQAKERKFMEENPKFNKKALAQNIYRLRKISTAVLCTLQYIKSCFQWESTQRSLTAFLIFLVTVWHWELFMLPLFLLLLLGWNYLLLSSGRVTANQDLVTMSTADDEEEDEKESGKKGLMEKIHMVQEMVTTVQNILDEVAGVGERIKNTFNWSVPFMSCLSCLVMIGATALLYYVQLRYIVLMWGVSKFTKKLRNPHGVDNNGILEFLKRVPSDVQKVQHSEHRAAALQNMPRKKR